MALQIARREQPGPARLLMLLNRLEPPDGALTLVLKAGESQGTPLSAASAALRSTLSTVAGPGAIFPFGLVLFWSRALSFAVRPPLPPKDSARLEGWDTRPLLDLLGRPHDLGIILLRRGGFSVGVFNGDMLVASKTGTRFVKNRHRKGGQSQRRFDRIREKQIDELFDKTCEVAWEKLRPFLPRIEAIFLGGDRRTVQAFRAQCDRLAQFGGRLQERFVPTPEPRQETLRLAYDMIWRSDWMELRNDADGSCRGLQYHGDAVP